MLKILLHRLFRDVARTPSSIPDCPEVSPPVPLVQLRVFLLQQAAGAPLHPLDQIRERLRRWILDVHVDMIFTDYSFKYPDIFSVADLQEQVSTSDLDVTFKHMITILRDPDDVCRQPCDRVPAVPIIFHEHDFYHAVEVCSN